MGKHYYCSTRFRGWFLSSAGLTDILHMFLSYSVNRWATSRNRVVIENVKLTFRLRCTDGILGTDPTCRRNLFCPVCSLACVDGEFLYSYSTLQFELGRKDTTSESNSRLVSRILDVVIRCLLTGYRSIVSAGSISLQFPFESAARWSHHFAQCAFHGAQKVLQETRDEGTKAVKNSKCTCFFTCAFF